MTDFSSVKRRDLLKWTTPVVTAIVLPAHAATSGGACGGPPILNLISAPKCSGNPPVGTAVIEILAFDECEQIVKGFTVTTDDAKSDLNSLPTFPLTLSETNGETFTWIGPASDGTTCLPLASISLEVEYCCEDGVSLFQTYNITELLINGSVAKMKGKKYD